jgi:enoyl-CoA hydratase/carnithine racemase
MGLVEIGVGLLPGGGGCKNLWKKMTCDIPAPVTDVDLAKFFIPTFMAIAMAKVSMSAAEARANGFLGPKDRIVFNRDYLIGEAKKEVLKMVGGRLRTAGKTPHQGFRRRGPGHDQRRAVQHAAPSTSANTTYSWPNGSPACHQRRRCAHQQLCR